MAPKDLPPFTRRISGAGCGTSYPLQAFAFTFGAMGVLDRMMKACNANSVYLS